MPPSEIIATNVRDDDLMKQIAQKNINAFRILMDRYQDKALRFCFRQLGDYHLAEDVSQDGFVKLYDKAEQYQPEGKFTGFFYKMLLNLCRDVPKKIKYRSLVSNNPGLEELPDNSTASSPTQALDTNETSSLVRQAIDTLPSKYRQAVILKELEGLKYHEIARIMDCSTDNIKVWLHRAKKQLAEKLEPLMNG